MADSSSSSRSRAGLIALTGAALLLGGIFLLLGTARLGAFGRSPTFHGTEWQPSQTAADFRLVDHTGRAVSLGDFRGRAVLLFFGYASCPDVCPLTLARLDRVLSGMGRAAEDVEVLLVSVDPQRDTPEALSRYVARFEPWVTGLTGDAPTLAAVRKSYYAYAEPATPASVPGAQSHAGHAPPAAAALLSHTPQVFGIDRRGEIRVLLPMQLGEEEIEDDIRALLRY